MSDKEVEFPAGTSADELENFFEGLNELLAESVDDPDEWTDEELDELFGPEDE